MAVKNEDKIIREHYFVDGKKVLRGSTAGSPHSFPWSYSRNLTGCPELDRLMVWFVFFYFAHAKCFFFPSLVFVLLE
jgi:hypothetical protein